MSALISRTRLNTHQPQDVRTGNSFKHPKWKTKKTWAAKNPSGYLKIVNLEVKRAKNLNHAVSEQPLTYFSKDTNKRFQILERVCFALLWDQCFFLRITYKNLNAILIFGTELKNYLGVRVKKSFMETSINYISILEGRGVMECFWQLVIRSWE